MGQPRPPRVHQPPHHLPGEQLHPSKGSGGGPDCQQSRTRWHTTAIFSRMLCVAVVVWGHCYPSGRCRKALFSTDRPLVVAFFWLICVRVGQVLRVESRVYFTRACCASPARTTGGDWQNSRRGLPGGSRHELGDFQASPGGCDGGAPCEFSNATI